MSFYLTREALNAVADDTRSPRIGDLHYRPGVGFSDPVLRHLLLSVRPALATEPTETSALTRYFDFAATSLAAFSMKAATDFGCDT